MAERPPLRVAGVGGGDGAVAALTRLVSTLRSDTGIAIVVHPPDQHATGGLAGVLSPIASIPVLDADSGTVVWPDHIYVVPPRMRAAFVGDKLILEPAGDRPLDGLLTSLATVLGVRAIGVLLSGTGSDGVEGIRAIRRVGGLAIVQEPRTAEHGELPTSAIATGAVDRVWSPERVGRELRVVASRDEKASPITRILEQLRDLAGIDFSTYKRATIERRLERQVARHQLSSLDAYADYLGDHPEEARALYEDLLVHVTEFFRDGSVFEDAVAKMLPEVLASRPPDTPIRIWVPGCSTGEEVYTLAMLVLEELERRGDTRGLQMFATDLSDRAISIGRAGRYPATIAEQVSQERLERFFVRDGSGWRVSRAVRDLCLFVRHDLASDPPFSRLDLVSCRNVLIYLGHSLQTRVIALFHYALEVPGFLLLGTSESLAGQEALFEPALPSLALYRRKPGTSRTTLVLAGRSPNLTRRPDIVHTAGDIYREVDHVLLAKYAPPCVLVDENFDILQFRGRTGAFLEPTPGIPQLNVFRMARDGLGPELRRVAQRAQRDNAPVRATDIVVGDSGDQRHIDVEVIPVRVGMVPRHFLIAFEERAASVPARKQRVRRGTADRVAQLDQELVATREYLSSVIAQHVATAQELGVINEELQSSNEELQSSNEELITAKEELQSTNEELATLNAQLENRNTALQILNDDLVNVLASVDAAIIIVDNNLAVRRFTPRARSLLKLIDSDIGRPIGDLQPTFTIADLPGVIRDVIDTLAIEEREVRDGAGNVYRLQVRPYRTAASQIAGAVLSFVDITALRASIEETARAHASERAARDALHREKEALLNAVSHELRTPLSAILLWTAVVRGSQPLRPEVATALDTIETAARTEAQLVDDLIDVAMSRTNSEALVVNLQTIAPCPIVEETVVSLRPAADEKQLSIVLDLEHDARVIADPRRVGQIAWHLVTNAIKFTPAGGRIDVRVGRSADVVELAVSDTGQGIQHEFLAHVFEPFAQVDGSSTRSHAGLGIGLSLVRYLVERQHGTIAVTSDARGATFTVCLPAA